MPVASRIMPMLSVADMAASRRFYEQVLGGTLIYQFPPEGEAAFLTLKFGETELGLGVLNREGRAWPAPAPASGHRVELCINVDDVDAAVAALGAPVVMAPVDQPWGERGRLCRGPGR